MLILKTHNFFFFSRQEIWCYNGGSYPYAGYSVFVASKKPPGKRANLFSNFFSVIVDLKKPSEILLKEVYPRVREEIKQGLKIDYDFKITHNPSYEFCLELFREFNLFATQKKFQRVKKNWIRAAVASGNFVVTQIFYNNRQICFHTYLVIDNSAYLVHSFQNNYSGDKKIIGVANKTLHWKDIIAFKASGLSFYDLGPVNPELQGISQFKRRFSSSDLQQNYRYIISSPLLNLAVSIYKKIFS